MPRNLNFGRPTDRLAGGLKPKLTGSPPLHPHETDKVRDSEVEVSTLLRVLPRKGESFSGARCLDQKGFHRKQRLGAVEFCAAKPIGFRRLAI